MIYFLQKEVPTSSKYYLYKNVEVVVFLSGRPKLAVWTSL